MKKNKLILIIILPFLAGLVNLNVASAQVYHSLKITVSAETGESVENADLNLENTFTGMQYNKTLPADGIVEFSKLLEGTYKLTISKIGLPGYKHEIVLDQNLDLAIIIQENKVTPYGLKSAITYNENTGNGIVHFTWNNDTDAFFDDFEDHEPFAISFSPWTGIDGDNAQPFPLDISYPNYLNPQYAIIFNPAKTSPSRLGYMELMPYSGLQCAAFFRANNVPNNDWLIAPKKRIKEGDVVSFMAKALGVNFAEEQFRVAISTTNNSDIKSFKTISNGNSENANGIWTRYEYDLSEYVGQEVYIAINYMSAFRQMLMVDDFYIGRNADMRSAKARRAVTDDVYPHYVIYLDGAEKKTVQTTGCRLDEVASGTHTLGVKARYKSGDTAMETMEITIDEKSVFASITLHVTANNGTPTEGFHVNFTRDNLGQSYRKAVTDGKISIPYASRGIYEISIVEKGFETYTQTLDLTSGDQEQDIVLKEIISNPYNLTVDVEKGSDTGMNAYFAWNQDLGWSDGFESYGDFTQNPSPWITHDLDGKTSWGVNIGGSTISFPGTQSATGPIIFNPSATRPAIDQYETAATAEGEKYVLFVSAQMAKSNDWLISPVQEIKQHYVLRFILKSMNMPGVTDSVNICLSETSNVSDFKVISNITCNNEQWTKYEVSLEEYAGKSIFIGFNYVSFDGFTAQLDDVYVGPAETSGDDMGNIVEFEIYLDEKLVTKTTDNSYLFEDLEAGKTYKAGVKSIYKTGGSDLVELEFTSGSWSGNPTVEDVVFQLYPTIVTNNTFTIESDSPIEEVSLYGLEGTKVWSVEGNNQLKIKVNTEKLVHGLYIVKVNANYKTNTAKIIIK